MRHTAPPHSPSPHVLMLGITLVLGGCKDLTGSPGLPAGTPNPSVYNSASGALGMRNVAILQWELALAQYILDTGLLTDELESIQTGTTQRNAGEVVNPLDERLLPPSVTVASYGQLQGVRAVAAQAIGALAAYDTAAVARDSATVLRGELYAVEGYAEIMLADLFCSGVPLSTLDFQKDFTYAPSSTRDQVYQDAISKFDTALALASERDSVVHLAQVGKGRAYLDLGDYTAAADDVTAVPDGFLYQVAINWMTNSSNYGITNFLIGHGATVADQEGVNGLPFLSSGDPRNAVDTLVQPNPSGGGPYVPLTFPVKYSAGLGGSGYAPFTLASGVEARLIEAEAALRSNPGDGVWLAKLNALRSTVPGLGQISDPVDPVARVDTLFTERAYWLFLTGHRQGDLRRLLRQYGGQTAAFSSENRVYPAGPYLAPGTGFYGNSVVAPIPPTESANPDFHGCLSYAP